MGIEPDFWSAKERAALLQRVAVLPNPRGIAWQLPECALLALVHAEKGRNGDYRLRHGVREMEAGDILFRAGLVEARGPYLSNFAVKVRREAIALIAEREFG